MRMSRRLRTNLVRVVVLIVQVHEVQISIEVVVVEVVVILVVFIIELIVVQILVVQLVVERFIVDIIFVARPWGQAQRLELLQHDRTSPDGKGTASASYVLQAVSYTHLTLPT